MKPYLLPQRWPHGYELTQCQGILFSSLSSHLGIYGDDFYLVGSWVVDSLRSLSAEALKSDDFWYQAHAVLGLIRITGTSPGCTWFLPRFLHHWVSPDFVKLTQTHLPRHMAQSLLCRGALSFLFLKSSSRLSPPYPGLSLALLQDAQRMGIESLFLTNPLLSSPHCLPPKCPPPFSLMRSVEGGTLWLYHVCLQISSPVLLLSISSHIVILWNSKLTTSFSLFFLLYPPFWEAGRKREQLIRQKGEGI